MIRGEFIPYTVEELNDISLKTDTLRFRIKCVNAGFTIEQVYPIYYQGWEMDEWGAIGRKDGKIYVLETDHGSLMPEEIRNYSFQSIPILVFKKI